MMKTILSTALLFAICVLGCRPAAEHGHGHGHEHTPPHGGTPVILGNEDYHLEFVHDPEAGAIHAYILDGHMERFIRIPAESFEVAARLPDREETLLFRAVENSATGEKPGDTSQFTAQAEWLKTPARFEGVLKSITIRGREYAAVKFKFPKGNERAGKL